MYKQKLNADPYGVYVAGLAQKVGSGFFVSQRSNADGGYLVFKTAEVGTTLFAKRSESFLRKSA